MFVALLLLICEVLHSALTPEQIQQVVDAHNFVRCTVNPAAQAMARMGWDTSLATFAQAWADNCSLSKNPNRNSFGGRVEENIGGITGSLWDVVMNWAVKGSYVFGKCTGNCNSYTLIVWKISSKIGCGLAECSSSTGPILVCDYSPGGNLPNEQPYNEGTGSTEACKCSPTASSYSDNINNLISINNTCVCGLPGVPCTNNLRCDARTTSGKCVCGWTNGPCTGNQTDRCNRADTSGKCVCGTRESACPASEVCIDSRCICGSGPSCESNLTCNSALTCACGTTGGPCTNNLTCYGGNCRCGGINCPENEVCIDGKCFCGSNPTCTKNLTCNSTACVCKEKNAECTDNLTCSINRTCRCGTGAETCDNAEFCNSSTCVCGSIVCPVNETCFSNDTCVCGSGSSCINTNLTCNKQTSTCWCEKSGRVCDDNEVCASGTCVCRRDMNVCKDNLRCNQDGRCVCGLTDGPCTNNLTSYNRCNKNDTSGICVCGSTSGPCPSPDKPAYDICNGTMCVCGKKLCEEKDGETCIKGECVCGSEAEAKACESGKTCTLGMCQDDGDGKLGDDDDVDFPEGGGGGDGDDDNTGGGNKKKLMWWWWIIIIAGSVLSVCCIFIIVLVIRRRRKKKQEEIDKNTEWQRPYKDDSDWRKRKELYNAESESTPALDSASHGRTPSPSPAPQHTPSPSPVSKQTPSFTSQPPTSAGLHPSAGAGSVGGGRGVSSMAARFENK